MLDEILLEAAFTEEEIAADEVLCTLLFVGVEITAWGAQLTVKIKASRIREKLGKCFVISSSRFYSISYRNEDLACEIVRNSLSF